MFPDKDIVIASRMELSMNIKLAEKLHFEFNDNQNISANRVIGMQKYTKRSKRPLKHQYKRNVSYS